MARDRGRGRPCDTRLGEDLAVLCALAREGAGASPRDISELLGVTEARASEILHCLSSDSGCGSVDDESSGPMLALYASGSVGSMARVATLTTAPVPPLRLTIPQATAAAGALDRLGLKPSDPLRGAIERAFFPLDATGSPHPIAPEAHEAEAVGEGDACPLDTLMTCAKSIIAARVSPEEPARVSQPIVAFSYRGENDQMARSRRVIPREISLKEGLWLVGAHDLDARASRTFLASKMRNLCVLDELGSAPRHTSEQPGGGTVRLTCSPKAAARVRLWSGAREVAQLGDGRVEIDIPYFRGDWLPRHVLALGKDVTHNNEQLRQEMRAIARNDIRQARRTWRREP